jgi:hypothetical protein
MATKKKPCVCEVKKHLLALYASGKITSQAVIRDLKIMGDKLPEIRKWMADAKKVRKPVKKKARKPAKKKVRKPAKRRARKATRKTKKTAKRRAKR